MVIKGVFADQQRFKISNIPKEYVIKPGESVDYEVDYEEEVK